MVGHLPLLRLEQRLRVLDSAKRRSSAASATFITVSAPGPALAASGPPVSSRSGTFDNVTVGTEITGADVDRWAVGVDQALDSANMHLYAVYQHFTADVDLVDSSLNHVAAPLDDFQLFYSGARIYF